MGALTQTATQAGQVPLVLLVQILVSEVRLHSQPALVYPAVVQLDLSRLGGLVAQTR